MTICKGLNQVEIELEESDFDIDDLIDLIRDKICAERKRQANNNKNGKRSHTVIEFEDILEMLAEELRYDGYFSFKAKYMQEEDDIKEFIEGLENKRRAYEVG